MSCTHATTCPLFPKLNASLRGWRDAYCDTDAGWHRCARYTRSRSGVSVPLTLLPNGKYAHTIAGGQPAPTRFAAVPVSRRADPAAPFETAVSAPERVPAPPTDWSREWAEAPAPTVRATATVTRAPALPAPTAVRPGWWSRLVTWLRTPA